MKRIILILLVLLLALPLSACSKAKSVDAESLIEDALENIAFDDEIAEIAEGVIGRLYTLPEGVTGRVLIGSGATAEEFSVFTCESESAAKEMEENAKEHIAAQQEVYASYLPDEVERLDKAVVLRQGLSVIVCVSADENAEQTIKDYIS